MISDKLKLLHLRTHVAEDKAVLAEDTAGHDLYTDDVAYRRMQTLEYSERETETLQFNGEHTLPFPSVGVPGVVTFLEPEVDWTVAKSSSTLNTPDKRTFAATWSDGTPGELTYIPGIGWFQLPDIPPQYSADVNTEGVENFERIFKDIREESDQYFLNGKLPFEQWTGGKGYLKVGYFNDDVERSFDQDNYAPLFTSNTETFPADWDEFWSDFYDREIFESPYGAAYEAEQNISAWYWMVDMPLSSFFKVVGGTRYEKTTLEIEFEADEDTVWYDRETGLGTSLRDDPPNDAGFDNKDVLPVLGFEFTPLKDKLVFRANYSQTIARPTFKEISPVATQDYAGGDLFVGNPELKMSSLENYDLRADWTPYQGALVSLSWFRKKIKDPIEYTQDNVSFFGDFTTAANYPEGELSGYEVEVRQHIGQFVDSFDGLSVGGNLTLIDSEVTLPESEVQYYIDGGYGFVERTRDMTGAPEYLYNLFTTYDIERTGTKLGLFYTVTGDTLVAGPKSRGEYVQGVYALEYGTLNFSLSQKLGDHWTLAFKARNLLNPEIQEVYRSDYIEEGDVLKKSYTKGMEFSVSLGCEF